MKYPRGQLGKQKPKDPPAIKVVFCSHSLHLAIPVQRLHHVLQAWQLSLLLTNDPAEQVPLEFFFDESFPC